MNETKAQVSVAKYTPEDAHDWGNVPLAGFAILCLIAVAVTYAAERIYSRRDRKEVYNRLDTIKDAMPNKDTVEEIRRKQIDFEMRLISLQERQTTILEQMNAKTGELATGQAENFGRMWNLIEKTKQTG